MGNLQTIPISQIRENPVALRTVDRESEDYLGLVSSIRTKGFMGAIVVRPKVDPESQESYFELIDGLHRYSAAKDAGLDEINVDVQDLNDDLVLEAQIMANIHKVETRPAEYSQQLKRILARNPLMTEAELAGKLGKSPNWISQRLGLTKISNEQIVELINEGKISLSNAYALAKLPSEEQPEFTDRAITLPPDEFVPAIQQRVKEIREAKRAGADAKPPEFVPVPYLRKLKDAKSEYENPTAGSELVKRTKAKTANDGFALAVQWMLHMDPISVEAQRAEHEARQQKKADDAAKRKAEREKKKAEVAEQKAAEARKAAANAEAELKGEELPYPDLGKKEEPATEEAS